MASAAQDTPEVEKRVVVYVVTGRRAGMRRIIGHMIYKAGETLPAGFHDIHICDGEEPKDVQLVGEYPRYVLYREIGPTPPMVKTPRTPRVPKGAA